MKDKFELIPDPIPDPIFEPGFEGLYVGDLEDGEKCSTKFSSYDLRGLTKYLREYNLDQPTEEILKMFEM